MFTTGIYRLQKSNPSTFTVMMTKKQRKKIIKYLNQLDTEFLNIYSELENTQHLDVITKISNKLENNHMSYNDNELEIMRAAITWNKFIEPISFLLKKFFLVRYCSK